MNKQNTSKINQLIKIWKKGTIFTTAFLNKNKYSNELLNQYKKSRWIESAGHSAYKLYNDKIDWTGGVYALQNCENLSFHPGGKTSLIIKGYAHYIKPFIDTVYLYGFPKEKTPLWFDNYDWRVNIIAISTGLFKNNKNCGLENYKVNQFSVKISSPERAVLEMLYYIPKKQNFEDALLIFENLTTLRPEILQELLENCNSIKVKRLFLYMAEYHKHTWFKKLNNKNINIGKGKRVVCKNGILYKKYLITVPVVKKENIP